MALGGMGFLHLVWVYRFTDWFEETLKLLALGGVLSLLATVFKFVDKKRSETLQEEITQNVLLNKSTWKRVGFIGGGLLALMLAFVGSVQVEGGKGVGDARVQIYTESGRA